MPMTAAILVGPIELSLMIEKTMFVDDDLNMADYYPCSTCGGKRIKTSISDDNKMATYTCSNCNTTVKRYHYMWLVHQLNKEYN